jgi:hypothetical protein
MVRDPHRAREGERQLTRAPAGGVWTEERSDEGRRRPKSRRAALAKASAS